MVQLFKCCFAFFSEGSFAVSLLAWSVISPPTFHVRYKLLTPALLNSKQPRRSFTRAAEYRARLIAEGRGGRDQSTLISALRTAALVLQLLSLILLWSFVRFVGSMENRLHTGLRVLHCNIKALTENGSIWHYEEANQDLFVLTVRPIAKLKAH